MKITFDHLRTTKGLTRNGGLCWRQTRPWLVKHGFSPREFLANGIDEEKLLATGDAFAAEVVRQAHGR